MDRDCNAIGGDSPQHKAVQMDYGERFQADVKKASTSRLIPVLRLLRAVGWRTSAGRMTAESRGASKIAFGKELFVPGLVPRSILCRLNRHIPDRHKVKWDGLYYASTCAGCGAVIHRQSRKRWRKSKQDSDDTVRQPCSE